MINMLENEIKEVVVNNFINYVKIDTQSDENFSDYNGIETTPSSKKQFDLANILKKELSDIGVDEVEVDEFCYVYAVLKASEGVNAPSITFCAHLDTSPDVSGKDVKPIIRKYEGKALNFPDNETLVLDKNICPQLEYFINENIITASGNTLLGADDKAGIAEIMAALKILKKYPEIKHPELRIIFTPDEEIGRGTAKINPAKFAKYGYTLDGSILGELEGECFNAYSAKLTFNGKNIHPGFAKNKMINACSIAARFISALPEWESPEHTEKKEGFFHVNHFEGDESLAKVSMILRDFDYKLNLKRIDLLKSLIEFFEKKYPGLKIDIETKESYKNMFEIINQHPEVLDKAVKAIEMTGIRPVINAIRGGTDGARMSYMGMPTPNIFAGGMLFHSNLEWIPEKALVKAVQTILHLCTLWAQ